MDTTPDPTPQPGLPAPDDLPPTIRPVPDPTKPPTAPTPSVPGPAAGAPISAALVGATREDTPASAAPVGDVPPAAAPRVPLVSPGAAAILGVVGTVLLLFVTGAFNSDDSPAASSPSRGASATPAGGRVAQWYAGGGKTHVDRIESSTRDIGMAANSGNSKALQAACIDLFKDVTAAQGYRMVPDPDAQKYWASALTFFKSASTDCGNGASMDDPALLSASSRAMRQGGAEIDAMTRRLGEIDDSE
ncbi:hypothetical protein ACFRKE_00990 [Kitasatospora indigofera]|uniref:hypothetical protein n=1 Tax=Kitasatospora indigofera TaxID=67307 RepID=UPI00369BC85B